jgi:signal transduction histidine kinase
MRAPLLKPANSVPRRVGLALLIGVAGLAIAQVTESYLPGEQVLLVMLSAAVLCALYCGFMIGALSSLALACAHIYFFQEPRRTIVVPTEAQIFEVLFFLISALFVGWVSSVLRAAYYQAEQAKREAQSAAQATEDVVAIVSHDLKNPLSAIQINVQLLMRNPNVQSDSMIVKSVTAIERSSARAISLIRDLLDSEKIRTGNMTADLEVCSLKALIHEVKEMMAPVISSKSQHLVIHEPEHDLSLPFDYGRLFQVLSNLCGNASKFTAQGGTVEVGWQGHEHEVRVYVRDTGSGIPPEQVPRLFDRHWQASKTARQGTGLGLAIAKGIVEAHGGRIWVNSAVGQGSTFWFSIPLLERIQVVKKSAA